MSALVLGGILFISIVIGAAIAWLIATIFHHSNEGLALICGGFLVGILALELIPSALHSYKLPGIALGIFIGFMFLLLVNKLFHSSNQHKPSVYLLTIALFIHTIPLSLTIGNLLEDSSFARSITTSTILHHIPEGFALTSIFLSQGQKIINLFLCFISLSFCFSIFIWIGNQIHLDMKAQSILLGVSIGLIAITSVNEFILHNIHVMSIRSAATFIILGYLLSVLFHVVI